jgi:branched-chain amino acid transport system permease protein
VPSADVLALGSLSNLAQVTLGGLAAGGLYAVLLLGVLLVYQVSKNVNFAYGEIGVVGAFVAFVLFSDEGLPVVLALIVGVLAAVGLSIGMEVAIIRRIPRRQGFDLVVTLGALLLLTAGTDVVFGSADRQYTPLLSNHATVVHGVYVNASDVLAFGLGVIAAIAGWVVLKRTSVGVSLRASAEDSATAQSVGIDVRSLRTIVWAVAGILAAIGAMVAASRLVLDARYMTPVIINVFIAGMLGGLDRYWPPMIAAFGIALYTSLASYIFGTDASVPALFVLVILVLALAPKRFLEERHEARA